MYQYQRCRVEPMCSTASQNHQIFNQFHEIFDPHNAIMLFVKFDCRAMVKYHPKFNKSPMCLYGRLVNARVPKPTKISINPTKCSYPHNAIMLFVKFDYRTIVNHGFLPKTLTPTSVGSAFPTNEHRELNS